MRYLVLIFGLLGTFSFCYSQDIKIVTTDIYANYDLELINAQELKSAIKLNQTSNSFEDSLLQFKFSPESGILFSFEIKNKTESIIKIDWNNAVYIDVHGESIGIIHGNKDIDQNQNQLPTVIAPLSGISDLLFPKGQATFTNDKWEIKTKHYSSRAEAEAEKEYIENYSVKILLPIEIQGTILEYYFEFRYLNFNIIEDFSETICGIDANDVENKELIYRGYGRYKLGSKNFHYLDDNFQCYLENSGNKELVDMINTSLLKRRNSKVLLPIGLVAGGLGLIISASSEDVGVVIGPVIGVAGLTGFITSIVLRSESNIILKKLPLNYKPYQKSLTIGATNNGLGLSLNF